MTQAGVRSSILGPNSGVVSPGREGGPPYRSFFRSSNRSRSMRLFSLIHWRSCLRRSLVVDSIKKVRCERVSVERSTPIRFKASSNSGWVRGNSMATSPLARLLREAAAAEKPRPHERENAVESCRPMATRSQPRCCIRKPERL